MPVPIVHHHPTCRICPLWFLLSAVGCVEKPLTSATVLASSASVSAHRPYLAGNCGGCHDPLTQAPLPNVNGQACLACHENLLNRSRVVHAAVLAGACDRCHRPHESEFPALLAVGDQSLCTQCHALKSLSLRATAHRNSRRMCLDCHYGHGGQTSSLLREGAVTWQSPDARPGTADSMLRKK